MNHDPNLNETIEPDYILSISVNSPYRMYTHHFHANYEMYLCLCDGIRCFIDGKLFDINRGDLFVFSPFVLHRIIVPQNIMYERCIFSFKQDYIQDFSPVAASLLEIFPKPGDDFNTFVHLTESKLQELLLLLYKVNHYTIKPVYKQEIHIKLAIMEVLLYANTAFYTSTIPCDTSNDSGYQKLKPILNYINNNLSGGLSLDHLTEKFYLSKSHLGNLFKKNTGFTVTEYIINRRIAKARELLKHNYSVSQVCEMVGFNNYSHFIRTFTHLVGVSPKQYEKNRGTGNEGL